MFTPYFSLILHLCAFFPHVLFTMHYVTAFFKISDHVSVALCAFYSVKWT